MMLFYFKAEVLAASSDVMPHSDTHPMRAVGR
jgi:hypothetical protein